MHGKLGAGKSGSCLVKDEEVRQLKEEVVHWLKRSRARRRGTCAEPISARAVASARGGGSEVGLRGGVREGKGREGKEEGKGRS